MSHTELYSGKKIQCQILSGTDSGLDVTGFAELCFNASDDVVNKFDRETLTDFFASVAKIRENQSKIKGLLISSQKDSFIVGADITEFQTHFKKSEGELVEWLLSVDAVISQIEDFDFPSVAAINGFAFGGGCELTLATSYRVMAATGKIGLPETKLGIFPGWGGTVRMSRLCGADNAIEWIAGGEQYPAAEALKIGLVDAVVDAKKVREASLKLLVESAAGQRTPGQDWKSRRDEKKSPLKLNQIESTMAFEIAKGFVAAKTGPNYPSPVAAIEAMQKGSTLPRDEALKIEASIFAKIAKTPTAHSLVSVFLADQYVKKVSKKYSKAAKNPEMAAVLGAGIMGGGVAYQSASKGVPIVMKDIQNKAIDLGMSEASKLLEKQVSRGKMTPAKMAETLSRIRPTLNYGDFSSVDFVVEAVVENEAVKKKVLAEVEASLKPGAVLTSNTSTISINRLAEGLKNPERFCGMHFFNPVHRMPLVEIIRGSKTSEETIAATVAYSLAMGKTPIVVNDCAGFLVNRVLFPYLKGFMDLVADGVDYTRIDKVMEKFGWPMGPAYLLDVVGIDTACHADHVMATEFPDRMNHTGKTAIELMKEANRLGQKNGKGFYTYTLDKRGSPKKEIDVTAQEMVKSLYKVGPNSTVTDQEIIDRIMLPMIFECSRCLEDKIVDSPAEVDIALLYGLGFPPFRGGALRYADSVGAKQLVAASEKCLGLGKLYEPTAQIRKQAETQTGFYPTV